MNGWMGWDENDAEWTGAHGLWIGEGRRGIGGMYLSVSLLVSWLVS